MNFHRILLSVYLLGISMAAFAADPPRERMWEYLINERVMEYPLRTENLFRLAVYTELKGNYVPVQDALSLEFGSLGNLQFFSGHCLMKTTDGQVFSVKRGSGPSVQSESLDASLDRLFDQMPLLNDASANPLVVAQVDAYLSRKNLEPFDKLFLRHLLVHYGRYNAELDYVEFHSDWLAESNTAVQGFKNLDVPLKIRLDSRILRGYYLNSGGTVYVEDVPRTVAYATGEEYGENVTAFKVFMEKLLVRSVQYVVQQDNSRQPVAALDRPSAPLPSGYAVAAANRPTASSNDGTTIEIEPLYTPERWMNLMLGVLRARNINIGDGDVIRYFVDQSYFDDLYALMLPEEKTRAQAYFRSRGIAQP
ncbi:MAG: hypothetical protein NWR72_07915 [Bacteroidia bacterium]|nr:hypothetical protein [Bacteroidia bacterium]